MLVHARTQTDRHAHARVRIHTRNAMQPGAAQRNATQCVRAHAHTCELMVGALSLHTGIADLQVYRVHTDGTQNGHLGEEPPSDAQHAPTASPHPRPQPHARVHCTGRRSSSSSAGTSPSKISDDDMVHSPCCATVEEVVRRHMPRAYKYRAPIQLLFLRSGRCRREAARGRDG